ncbi:MAG: type IV pilus secretin PilQ [Nitrospirae bacterium]|nr:type IV pilus secretin PilQ [Nitrospirota bacterium]
MKTLKISIILLSFIVALGYAASTTPQETTKNPTITNISVNEKAGFTEVVIESDSPFTYTIYKPSDPYKVVVELNNTDPGKFTDKIVADRGAVAEIIPTKVEGPQSSARFDITLTAPAEVKPLLEGNSLILSIPSTPVAAEEKEQPQVVAEKPVEEPKAEKPSEEEKPVSTPEKKEEIPLKDATAINNIEVSKSDGQVLVLISGDGKMSPKVFQAKGNRLVIDIPKVSTQVKSLKVYEPPVAGIRVGKHPDKTRIVLDLTEASKFDISSKNSQIVVAFGKPATVVAKAEKPAVEEKMPLNSPKAKPETEVLTPGKYTGRKISLDFQDADLVHIFRLIADVSGYNIVVSPDVKGKFSMRLMNVPWDHALDIILRNYGLSKTVDGNIIRIAPTSVFAKERDEIAKAEEAKIKAEELVTKVYTVNYADPDKVRESIDKAKILTTRGNVSIDKRTNTLIIKDIEGRHQEYEKFIRTLDLATPQVVIDAKIVEVDTKFVKELGIQWGAWYQNGDVLVYGGATKKKSTDTTADALTGGVGYTGTAFNVNLPAAVGAGSGGALGLGLSAGKFLLDWQISALEGSGKGKIISNPRIMTLDNEKATIQQGKKIPYQTTSAEGTKTEFVDATLELTVTPHITPEGTVLMKIETKKNEADFSRGTPPAIDVKEAKTQVLVRDNDTVVIGGIFKNTKSNSVDGVPLLSKIPVLGWLFKKERDEDSTSELLIFITPRIVKKT